MEVIMILRYYFKIREGEKPLFFPTFTTVKTYLY